MSLPLLYWRAPIKAYLGERYDAWKYARAFDRARAGLLPPEGTLWTSGTTGTDADATLDALVVATASARTVHKASPRVVLFVRAGATGGREWLAFGCISTTGLEVYSFDRTNRRLVGYERGFETRQFWGYGVYKLGKLDLAAGKVKEVDGRIITDVTVNGGRNVVEWSIAPAPVRGANAFAVPRVVVTTVTPRTGWVSNNDWWPNLGDLVLVEGQPAVQYLGGVAASKAVSFLADGRLAVLAPKVLATVDLHQDQLQTSAIPQVERPEVAAFSPDGAWCYVGETSGDEFLVPTASGAPILIGDSYGMPKPFFADHRTLIILDNTRLRRIDCVSRAVSDEPRPGEHLGAFVRSKDVSAYMDYSSDQSIHLRRGDRTYSVPDIQGRHQLSLSPDGKWLVMKGQQGLSVFDAGTGQVVWEHDLNNDLHGGGPIKWSEDGTLGAVAGRQYVYVWSMKGPRWAARFPNSGSEGWSDVTISPNGTCLAASVAGKPRIAYWPNLPAATQPAR